MNRKLVHGYAGYSDPDHGGKVGTQSENDASGDKLKSGENVHFSGFHSMPEAPTTPDVKLHTTS